MSSEATVEHPRLELSPARRALIEAIPRGEVRPFSIVPEPIATALRSPSRGSGPGSWTGRTRGPPRTA